MTTRTMKREECTCYRAQALDELLRGLDVAIGHCVQDGSDLALNVAANLNLLIQGAKAMAEIDDE